MPPMAIGPEAITDTTSVTLPNPLAAPMEINEIHNRRRKAEKNAWGVAAMSPVEKWKSHSSLTNKPMAKRWDRKCILLLRGYVV